MNPLDDANLYDENYFTGYDYDNDPRRAEMYRQEIGRITRLVNGGRILDVGCGTGGFLSCLDDRWMKYGIEPSKYAAKKAEQRGITILDKFPQWALDVVVFRGTIQHISTPLIDIAGAYEALRPDGLIVFLATPNTGGIVYRLWHDLPALEPARNWCLFSDGELTNILKRIGFKCISVRYPYLSTPYANLPKDLAHFFLRFFGVRRKFAFPHNMMEVYAWKPSPM